ncbi:Pre-mRNA-splicing factor srp1 [Yarrowia sp. C11]|nr:Pre-mRNA-splicing factor srp1 [Yarrowia sp. E02]KAG5372829.1 Pre-mRNA-splicing factor srp1 [Yarrowia sp. C11]
MARRTLYVTGFAPDISARELASEFEEIGNIFRCDVISPARSGRQHGYAFVEFENARDAEYAYRDMHNMRIPSGDILHIEWAKTPLRETRRRRRSLDRGSAHRRSRMGNGNGDRSRSRSRSPERRSRSPERRSRSPNRGRTGRNERRDFSDSPERDPSMNDISETENGVEERAESRFDQTSSQHESNHTPANESDSTMVGSAQNSVDGKESEESASMRAEVEP